jgi:hypothetical protein
VPIPLAARPKAWFCSRSLAGIAVSNPTEGHGCLSVVSAVFCQVQIAARFSLFKRSPTDSVGSNGI